MPRTKSHSLAMPRYFLTSVILILIFGILSLFLLKRSFDAASWIEHRRQIQTELDGIKSVIFEMEAAQRGYFLTKDKDVSGDFARARSELDHHIESAQSLALSTDVIASLDSLKAMIDGRVELMEDVDSLFTKEGNITKSVQKKIVVGDKVMDEVRFIIDGLQARQDVLLNQRISGRTLQRKLVYACIAIFTLITIIVISSGFSRLKKDREYLIEADRTRERLLVQLGKSEQRYRSINESSQDAIIIADASGVIQSWNPAASEMFGYSSDEARPKTIDILISEAHVENRVLKTFDEFLQKDGESLMGKRFQLSCIRKGGEKFPAELSLADWKEDEITYISGSIRDLSEQEMLNDQLQSTLNDLERSNQELEQFAYVASHDLQEPLRKIRAFGDRLITKMAVPEPNKEQLNDYANRMAKAAERMQGLIQDLLDFSRVSRDVGERSDVDLNVLVATVLDDLEYFIEENQGKVVVEELPTLTYVSRNQMHQLFQNLISNGIKFRSADTAPFVEIKYAVVKAKELKERGFTPEVLRYHQFTVKDNGIGFNEKYMDKIFAIFQRLHDRSTYKGTGIGLAMCKRICENHRGFISASSEEGVGATFDVYIPTK